MTPAQRTAVLRRRAIAPPGPITLFDTAAGSLFTDLQFSGTDASLTVAAGQITQNSSTVLNIDASVKRSGSVIRHCLDAWTVRADIRIRSWPVNAAGLRYGILSYAGFPFGGEVKRHGGGATYALHSAVLNGGNQTIDPLSGYDITAQPTAIITASREGGLLKATCNYAGTGDRIITETMVFAATSYELPKMFSEFALRFGSGQIDVNSLKVTAEYKNARFAFLGDSITQGRFATNYADGFAAKIRSSYPGEVLIAGAPSATSADWLANIQSVTMMTPRRVFLMMGTNDISNAVPQATWQANMLSIIAALESAGASVVLLSITPRSYSPVRTSWNPWLQSIGRPYIDLYTPLASGDDLSASYSADGLHPNSAGHAVIASTIQSAITANGW